MAHEKSFVFHKCTTMCCCTGARSNPRRFRVKKGIHVELYVEHSQEFLN